jgi:hypothetical protein
LWQFWVTFELSSNEAPEAMSLVAPLTFHFAAANFVVATPVGDRLEKVGMRVRHWELSGSRSSESGECPTPSR